MRLEIEDWRLVRPSIFSIFDGRARSIEPFSKRSMFPYSLSSDGVVMAMMRIGAWVFTLTLTRWSLLTVLCFKAFASKFSSILCWSNLIEYWCTLMLELSKFSTLRLGIILLFPERLTSRQFFFLQGVRWIIQVDNYLNGGNFTWVLVISINCQGKLRKAMNIAWSDSIMSYFIHGRPLRKQQSCPSWNITIILVA